MDEISQSLALTQNMSWRMERARMTTEPTGDQIRAARGLLDWSRDDLARASGLSRSTVVRLESGAPARPVNLLAIRSVFEAEGLQFVPGGVQRRGDKGACSG